MLNFSVCVRMNLVFRINGKSNLRYFYLKMLWRGLPAENYHPVSPLSVVSEVFDKLINNRLVDLFENYGLFSDFQLGFRSSCSKADLLTVLSDRISLACNDLGLLER